MAEAWVKYIPDTPVSSIAGMPSYLAPVNHPGPGQQNRHPFADLRIRRQDQLGTRNEYDVVSVLQLRNQWGDRFTHAAFDSISRYGIADFFAYRKAYLSFTGSVFCVYESTEPAGLRFTQGVRIAKFFFSF